MKKKLIVAVLAVTMLVLGCMAFDGYAFDHGKSKGHSISFEDKFSKKAHFLMSKQEELGLSDAQMEKIKEIKMKTKKELIRKDADIEILALDIKAQMYKDPMDTDALIKLVDKKYDLKKEKTKIAIEACAALKAALTKEQSQKMKELLKSCAKQKKMGSDMKCRMMMGGGDKK